MEPRTCKTLRPHLIFEHFTTESPYQRQPLTDAVHELAESACPQLLTLSSAELHPYSWLSIGTPLGVLAVAVEAFPAHAKANVSVPVLLSQSLLPVLLSQTVSSLRSVVPSL